jgi:hypothetical protein
MSTTNAERIRYHSSDDMDGVGELPGVTEPVAVVIRPDGSLDVYGDVAIVDQRTPLDYVERARQARIARGEPDGEVVGLPPA